MLALFYNSISKRNCKTIILPDNLKSNKLALGLEQGWQDEKQWKTPPARRRGKGGGG
jgi:hypothetical protein